jgi:hypothetical protein
LIISTKQEVERFLIKCKLSAHNQIFLAKRPENKATLLALGYSLENVRDEILQLHSEDYSYGPEGGKNGYAGEAFVFGKIIQNREVYIKVKLSNFNEVGDKELNAFCISFHFSTAPLSYPYRKDQ